MALAEPKPLAYYPVEFRQLLNEAMQKPAQWCYLSFPTARLAKNGHLILTGMRSGLKKFGEGELRTLAENKRIKLTCPLAPPSGPHKVGLMITMRAERPSDIAAQAWQDFLAGRRSTPF